MHLPLTRQTASCASACVNKSKPFIVSPPRSRPAPPRRALPPSPRKTFFSSPPRPPTHPPLLPSLGGPGGLLSLEPGLPSLRPHMPLLLQPFPEARVPSPRAAELELSKHEREFMGLSGWHGCGWGWAGRIGFLRGETRENTIAGGKNNSTWYSVCTHSEGVSA